MNGPDARRSVSTISGIASPADGPLLSLRDISPARGGISFATIAIEHGMDVKTLSGMIGHISVDTTLNIYSHFTTEMQKNAAKKIDERLGSAAPQAKDPIGAAMEAEVPPPGMRYDPYKGKICKSGSGGIYKINDHLYEGRYTPTNAYGKREPHNVYAKTREECETLLEKMIKEVRARIKEEKDALKAEQTE